MRKRTTFPLILLFLTAAALPAMAEMRVPYEDAQVVDRSEFIVIASIKPGSVVMVPHDRRAPDSARPWDTHAVLSIQEVIKGELKEKELPIVIRFGLEVAVDRARFDRSADQPTSLPVPKKNMTIEDTADYPYTICKDAGNPNIWFLRKGGQNAMPDDTGYGVQDPEDIQPLALWKYFDCYLKPDPTPPAKMETSESRVRAFLEKDPTIGPRALRFLEHCQVQRILREPNAALRVEQLLPYYKSGAKWGFTDETRKGIIAAGDAAGPYLMALYQESTGNSRLDIIGMLAHIRYKGSVETFIKVLTDQDAFWAPQDLKKNWRQDQQNPAVTRMRQDSANLIYYAAYALSEIGDPRARHALEITRARWSSPNFDTPQIVETCDAGLKKMPAP